MLATLPDPLLEGLVPATRLGAVLGRWRQCRHETITAVARRCPGGWTPDRLGAVERGEGVPAAELDAVVSAYGLDDGRWGPPSALRVVLDRSPVASLDAAHDPHWQLMRLAAVAVAVGLDGRWRGDGATLLAETLGTSATTVADELAEAVVAGHDLVTDWVGRARSLPVVPAAGVLLARGVGGQLVLTAPPRPLADRSVSPTCRLGALVSD